MNDNNLDRLIKDTYMEFNDEMDIHSDIEVPDFNIVMNKFHSNLKGKRKSSSISKGIAMVVSFTIVVLISTLISSIPKVIAFKFKVIKTFEELRGDTKDIKVSTNDDLDNNSNDNVSESNSGVDQIEKLVSIEEAKKEVPFKLLIPKYLPSGYKLESVRLVKALGNYFSVNQTYTTSTGEIIQIYQSTISEIAEETISMSSELKVEDITINDRKVKLTTDNENFKNILWFDNNIKFEILVPYNVTDNEVKKIIQLLK